MNEKQLLDYLEKTANLCDNLPKQRFRPIIITDSKGDYLKNPLNETQRSIVWLTKKGRKTEEGTDWFI